MIKIFTTLHTTPDVRSYRTHSFENIYDSISKITDVQIIWLVYKSERIDKKKYSDKNNIILDIHDFDNAIDAINKIKPDLIWAAPTLNLPDFAISIAGKKLGIPVVGELVNELFTKNDKIELFKTYISHFISSSIPTDQKNDKKKFMKRGRFFLYKFLFLLKTQKKAQWNIFKIWKYFFILIKAHLTVYQDLHDPRFSCDLHFVETEKLIDKLVKKGYDKKKLIVTGIPMYDLAVKQIHEFKNIKKKTDKINVLFLTHAMYEHGIWTKKQRDSLVRNVITELCKYKDRISITVKIHPSSELISDYESLIYPIDRTIEIIQKGNIIERIASSDIIVTYSGASSLVYALISKKPIIVCNFYDLQNDIFVDRKVVTECKNEKEVISKIQELNDNNIINEHDIDNFIEEFFYKLDGKSSERISNEIMKIVGKK